MNPVLILTHNCLELTKRCVESVRRQDIPTNIAGIDNGSTDGTDEWLRENGLRWFGFNHNAGVSKGWNAGLDRMFDVMPRSHVLVINNDTILPPWFYRTLLSCDVPFVTGVSFDNLDAVMAPPTVSLTDGPDFSAFLIRRSCWEKVGPFDESMKHYASDMDYHVRAHRAGVPLLNSHVKFYHERSSTIRLSPDAAEIRAQADRDRQAFKRKWGVNCDDREGYARLFQESAVSSEVQSA